MPFKRNPQNTFLFPKPPCTKHIIYTFLFNTPVPHIYIYIYIYTRKIQWNSNQIQNFLFMRKGTFSNECIGMGHFLNWSRPSDVYMRQYAHEWPSTQPNWITHNRAAHNPAARWCAGSVVCVTHMGNPRHNLTSQTTMQFGLTLAQRRDDSTDIGPTYNAVWEYCTQPNLHTTEPLGCVQLGCVLLGCVQFG